MNWERFIINTLYSFILWIKWSFDMDLSWIDISKTFYFVSSRFEEVVCDLLALGVSDISTTDTLAEREGVVTSSEEANRNVISVDTF